MAGMVSTASLPPSPFTWAGISSAPVSPTLSPFSFSGKTSLSERDRLSSATSVSSNGSDGSQRQCRNWEAENANPTAFVIADRDKHRHDLWSRKKLLSLGKPHDLGIPFFGR